MTHTQTATSRPRFCNGVVEIRSGDWTDRSVVLLIWAVTGVVLY